MKALILKDLYNLHKTGKTTLIVLLLYGVFGIVVGQASFLAAMIAIFCATLSISSFSYDDYSKWDNYALSMPVTRKTIILSKYLLAVLMVLTGCAIALVVGLISILINKGPVSELLMSVGASSLICFLVVAVVLPIIVKLGVEKGRVAMLTVFFVPAILILLLSKMGISDWLPSFSGEALKSLLVTALWLSPFLLIAMLLLSFFLSLKFYQAKEF